MHDKALLTAQKYFEEDELSQFAYQKILDSYLNLLPETLEKVIVANNKQEATKEQQFGFRGINFLIEKCFCADFG